ncbi:unnamed protein product, partial [Meganyctiphanes norvegica]
SQLSPLELDASKESFRIFKGFSAAKGFLGIPFLFPVCSQSDLDFFFDFLGFSCCGVPESDLEDECFFCYECFFCVSLLAFFFFDDDDVDAVLDFFVLDFVDFADLLLLVPCFSSPLVKGLFADKLGRIRD